MSELVDAFFSLANESASVAQKAARYDQTINGEIKAIVNVDIGQYKVAYQGNVIDAFSQDPLVTYKIGEQVQVLVPQGDFSQRKTIQGRTAYRNSLTYEERQDMTNFYVVKGPNWVHEWYPLGTQMPLQICAVEEDKKSYLVTRDGVGAYWSDVGFSRQLPNPRDPKSRYPAVIPTAAELQTADQSFQLYSAAYEGVKVSADFRTVFYNTHISGQYALVVECIQTNPLYISDWRHPDAQTRMGDAWFALAKQKAELETQRDAAIAEGRTRDAEQLSAQIASIEQEMARAALESPYKPVELRLGFSSFSGSPYAYASDTQQYAYFYFEKGALKGLNRIYLEQDGEFVADVMPSYNGDGSIDYNALNVIYDKNNIFCDNIDIRFCEKINLTDSLYYGWIETPFGDTVYSGSSESVGRGSVDLIAHLQYGYQDILTPDACQCIWFREDANVTENFAKSRNWAPEGHGNTYFDYGGPGWYPVDLLIAEGDLGGTGQRYHDVNFNQLTVSKEAIPYKWRYKVVMIYRDQGVASLPEITRSEVIQEITRLDSQYDLELKQTTSVDGKDVLLSVIDHKSAVPELDWFGTWYVLTQGGAYTRISDPYHKGPISINTWLHDDVATFFVQAYDPQLVDPNNTGAAVRQVRETAVLSKVVIAAKEGDLLVTWHGDDSFNYDALGTIRGDVDLQDHTLIPVIEWMNGRASDYILTILGPDGETPLSNKEFYNQTIDTGKAYTWLDISQNNRSMMKNMWVDFENTIHFQVESQYEPERARPDNNRFTLRISTLSGEVYEVRKTVGFSKDGDMGTIGSDWVAPIRPCNWEYDAAHPESQYLEEIDYSIAPLVLDNYYAGQGLEQSSKFRLFLRPFIKKNGVPLENLDPFEGYFAKIYWDVRMPGFADNEKVKYASFLRLYHTDGVSATQTNPGNIYGRQKSWYETGNIEIGSDGLSSDWDSKVNPHETATSKDGLVAFTMYPRKQYEDEYTREASQAIVPAGVDLTKENYGAVEVRFFNNEKLGTGATLEDCMYRFIVKAQVDIMKGQWDQNSKRIRTEGNIERVASITSYWPVDVVIDYNSRTVSTFFDDNPDFYKKVITNWPRFVKYNAAGYDPNNSDRPLSFKYDNGENKNYVAWNLTPLTQTLEVLLNPSTAEQNQRYRAKPHLNLTEGFHGALKTEEVPTEWKNAAFIRNQIMYLDAYGNVDINGWDGVGIDMNEKDGTIFANTIGAGYKIPQTNRFTGVLMGVDRSQKKADVGGYIGSYDNEALKYRQYMTGLFGYQDGVSSFGLQENGTAFFGRADGGGRIIIDGANATLYGGANGVLESPSIGDPMWNTMRLSLVDLTHRTAPETNTGRYLNYNGFLYYEDAAGNIRKVEADEAEIESLYTGVKGANGNYIAQGFDGKYFVSPFGNQAISNNQLPAWYKHIWQKAYIKPDGQLPYWMGNTEYDDLPDYFGQLTPDKTKHYKINYFGPDVDAQGNIIGDSKILSKLTPSSEGGCGQLSGFGATRASTTPAIEVGQHIHGLMPGLIDWDEYQNVFKTLTIPGDRNFLVTYDGTLWAMNGVFMGVIIGSNIVGGRIQGAEIGIGQNSPGDRKYWTVTNSTCDFTRLDAPKDVLVELSQDIPNVAFYVDSQGNVATRSLKIYGGSIDVGHFHIIGKDDNTLEYGHLIQVAESDFIGATHFYGNVGIGPALGRPIDYQFGSSYGHLVQSHGLVALGIAVPQNGNTVDINIHKTFIESLRRGVPYESIIGASETVNSWTYGNPQIGKGATAEQSAMFGIDSASGSIPLSATDSGRGFRGHFWPMHFHFGGTMIVPANAPSLEQTTNAYFTTMNLFASKGATFSNDSRNGKTLSGANYFRVGPYGTEAMVTYIRKNFQPQALSTVPWGYNASGSNDREAPYLGFMGLANRSGDVSAGDDQFAIGITSWYQAPIMLLSDGEGAFRSRGHIQIAAQSWAKSGSMPYKASVDLHLYPLKFGASLVMGTNAETQVGATNTFSKPDANKIIMKTAKSYLSFGVENCTLSTDTLDGYAVVDGYNTKHAAGLFIDPFGTRNSYRPEVRLFAASNNSAANKNEIHIVHQGAEYGVDCRTSAKGQTEILVDHESIYMYAPNRIVMGFGKNLAGGAHGLKSGAAGSSELIWDVDSSSTTKMRIGRTINGVFSGIEFGNDGIAFIGKYAEAANQNKIYARFG